MLDSGLESTYKSVEEGISLAQRNSGFEVSSNPGRVIDAATLFVQSNNIDAESYVFETRKAKHINNHKAYALRNQKRGISMLHGGYNRDMDNFSYYNRMRNVIEYLAELKEADDIPSQVQHYAPILRVIKEIISKLDPEIERYLQRTLLLFVTMLKRHSCEEVMTWDKVDAMIHVASDCMINTIDKESFLAHHDYLEEHGLDMFPSLED